MSHPTYINVSIIEPVGGHGGMDYYDYGLCSALSQAGAQISLHTCDKTDLTSSNLFAVYRDYVDIYGKDPAWKRGLRFIRGTFLALFHARSLKAQICHFHFFKIGVLEALNSFLARLFGFKLVITIHDVEPFDHQSKLPILSRLTYFLASGVIVHNIISKHELLRVSNINQDKISIIPHGNYLSYTGQLPDKRLAHKALNLPPDSTVLLFFGQIKEVKGLDILLESLPRVIKNHKNTILLIAGRPWKTTFDEYEIKIKNLGIENHCFCHIRFIPDNEVPIFFGAADLVVLPYRRIYQSGVILMSMSYEKPVIASDLPGMKEVITDNITGYLFRSGDCNSLADRIIEVLSSINSSKNVAREGKKLMERNYNWEMIGEKTVNFYRSILIKNG